jgi:uncharacterized protein
LKRRKSKKKLRKLNPVTRLKMRNLLVSILIFLIIAVPVLSQNTDGPGEFRNFWEIRDRALRNKGLSPLLPADFEKFEGLKYFAFDENYRLKAKLIKSTETKTFLIPTSLGGTRKYLKIGDLKFKLNGNEFTLGAYLNEFLAADASADLFVPFKDLTNGDETYSAGRYVYLRKPKDNEEAVLDFNIAFNPNCAYNTNFACTLPPKENFLQVEIKAGEKRFVSLSGKSTH